MAREWDNMLSSLPTAYRKDAWVIALLSAIAGVDSAQRADADETAQQMFLDSMTWALAIEERIAGITPAAGEGVEERRSVLQAKWRSATGKCDVDLIQRVCDSWQNGEVDVDFVDGEIVLRFVGAYGVPDADALAALQSAVQEVIPAHLAVKYLYRYLLVREVSAMTVSELQTHTIDEFAF
ncbi:MAG TPA: YmfQ family protein [Candidatus Agathobaculum intestinigallinarum]|nr:YmfQ family protein [Candidatus Agathobaculum intestinigallinarum]